jgi:hypothetical protein
MDPKHLAQFLALASALSPENLFCDGERPRAEARRVERSLKARWAKLEAEVGRKVDEGEVWAAHVRTLRPVGQTTRF